ncbi:hypothetical protein CVT26_014198 [Gymnopilus dilepis]|uniref:ZW10 C-terminal helical domain-containing protein n=1 Tax=Gymnopilus dilepis TaxID=231916 RepID=A0A409VU54_9AGAR|nr:hypothetical protein CVT26_014198 [Gymnopilus dilepis]
MAFPVPEHLPRRPVPIDVSSQILYKIDSASKETLNSSLASSWIRELDESILSTKQRIHDRIHSDLPAFRFQLETAKSIQARYDDLGQRVGDLENSFSNKETGIFPTLVSALEKHSALAQEASDAHAIYEASAFLLQWKTEYSRLVSLVEAGQLPEAVRQSEHIQGIVDREPESLKGTNISINFKQAFYTTNARIQDQLNDAYSRSVIIMPSEIIIYPTVQVRQSETVLDLPSIVHSLSSTSLENHLTTLRRDILAYYVDNVLKQPYSIAFENSLTNETKLSLIPLPPDQADLSSRLENMSNILGFLSSNLFQHFPSRERSSFTRNLVKPITTSILNNLLMPSLPSSFGLLPSYLTFLKRAVEFEERDMCTLLNSDVHDGSIKAWSDGVSGHYERRRRVEILERARAEILQPENPSETFEAVSEGGPETSLPSVIPVQMDEDFKDDAWGFDEPSTAAPIEESADGWGFEDDLEIESTTVEADKEVVESPTTPTEKDKGPDPSEPDPADAWDWNEGDDLPSEDIPEDNVWDDPWGDPASTEVAPEPPKPVAQPKAATRLEKLASKNKKQMNGSSASSPTSSPEPSKPDTIITTPPSPQVKSNTAQSKSSRTNGIKRPAEVITTVAPKEYYKVPKRTKRILKMVEAAIDESKLFYASNLFPPSNTSSDASSQPGTVLAHSASSIVELYQALYPIKFAEELGSADRSMLFSNSCCYMTGAIQRIEDTIYGQTILKERLTECRKRLQVLGDSWFDDTIEREQLKVDTTLAERGQGFTYTGDQDRYDECEAAVNQVVKDIKRLSQSLKGVLTKSKYYSAIGSVTDSALSRVLHDILELPDIPEVESHRLSELCRIFNSLEGLFSEDPEQPSFVVAYVPSWLKFSYLSELLEASLADITYLFEQGALVDFQVDELVSLVKALFADTSLRTNTINKLLNGHPQPSQ